MLITILQWMQWVATTKCITVICWGYSDSTSNSMGSRCMEAPTLHIPLRVTEYPDLEKYCHSLTRLGQKPSTTHVISLWEHFRIAVVHVDDARAILDGQ